MVSFFVCRTIMGKAWKVIDDSSRNYGVYSTKKQAEERCKKLQNKYY